MLPFAWGTCRTTGGTVKAAWLLSVASISRRAFCFVGITPHSPSDGHGLGSYRFGWGSWGWILRSVIPFRSTLALGVLGRLMGCGVSDGLFGRRNGMIRLPERRSSSTAGWRLSRFFFPFGLSDLF
jgi:hypothetical protein